jgi:glucose/arabinose dehydrogenase
MPARVISAASVLLAWLMLGTSGAAAPAPNLRLEAYASGFSAPVAFVQDPADSRVQFVVEQAGFIRAIVSGAVQSTPFLDIHWNILSGGEQGLLGLAFPPDAASSGRFYVNYTDLSGNTVVARFKRSADPHVADTRTGFALLWSTGERVIRQPFANHNGGCMAFGPDGFLYISMGDGGSGNDPLDNAQNPNSLLGKMLRIDVSVSDSDNAGFRVPSTNPFAAVSGYRPEIWAIGLRNPWRFSFDDAGTGATGALMIGDVGQGQWEEVDYQPAGAGGRNYGWVVREGAHPTPGISGVAPAFLPLIDPAYEYDHTVGVAVIGGYFSRGAALPEVAGRYFFADYSSGHIYSGALSLSPGGLDAMLVDVTDHTAALRTGVTSGNISAFGRNAAGDLFVVDYSQGMVWRITHQVQAPTNLRIIR